ncbi:hypothetical protein OA144_00010 [bacterium]|nr:hypothetical protein [bacterium]MEC8402089.1 hypothetical protein [Bacteroidota bacterium]
MLQNLLFNLAQRTLNPDVRRRVEGILVTTALVLFGLHLALYGMHAFWGLGLPDSLFAHPLQTLYTPFSVILIAEVYLLVYYLPTSFARSLGKQVEIVALIEIRSVFKDLDATSSWPWEATFFPHMLSALVLGGMLVLFYHLLPRRKARIEESELKQFVRFKTALAGLLAVAFVVLSVYSLGTWLWEIVTTPDHLHSDLNHVFYNEFFTALILVDVLLLVVSFRYLDDFGMVLRNSGFIVATILLRRALGIEPWHALAYEITAAALAVGMLLLERGLNARESGLLVQDGQVDVVPKQSNNELTV